MNDNKTLKEKIISILIQIEDTNALDYLLGFVTSVHDDESTQNYPE